MTKFRFLIILSLLLALLFTTSCDPGEDIAEGVENAALTAAQAIDEAIRMIARESESWEKFLEDMLAKLPEDSRALIKADIDNLVSKALAMTGAEFRCEGKYVGDYVRGQLIAIKAELLGQEIPPSDFVVCNTIPTIIDLSLSEPPKSVEFWGYDFQGRPIKVWHVSSRGIRRDVSNKLGRNSEFLRTLDFGRLGVPLTSQSEKIQIGIEDRVLYDVRIYQPEMKACEVKVGEVRAGKQVTVLTDELLREDGEFKGNGPMMDLYASIYHSGSEISTCITLYAEETCCDYTYLRGSECVQLYLMTDPNWEISELLTVGEFTHSYTDNDVYDDPFDLGGGVITHLDYTGDTAGEDFGRTQVKVTFGAIPFKMREIGNCLDPTEVKPSDLSIWSLGEIESSVEEVLESAPPGVHMTQEGFSEMWEDLLQNP